MTRPKLPDRLPMNISMNQMADVTVKIHTGTQVVFLCSRGSFPAVYECTPPASMLRGTHGRPVPANNPHGGRAGWPNRSGPTPSKPVSAVVQGQAERFPREPANRTWPTPSWACWYAHVRLEVRAGHEGNYSRKFHLITCTGLKRCARSQRSAQPPRRCSRSCRSSCAPSS